MAKALSISELLVAVADDLRGNWGPNCYIGDSVRRLGNGATSSWAMERIRDFLGSTVVAWGLKPGRTEAEAVELLQATARAAVKPVKPETKKTVHFARCSSPEAACG